MRIHFEIDEDGQRHALAFEHKDDDAAIRSVFSDAAEEVVARRRAASRHGQGHPHAAVPPAVKVAL